MEGGLSLVKNPTNLVFKEAPLNTWNHCEASSFQLRVGPNYSKNGKKDASPPALMELVGIDCLNCSKRVDNIAGQMLFPSSWGSNAIDTVPSIFVVNVQLPSTFPTSVFKEITDGPGWSLVFYYKWTEAGLAKIAEAVNNAQNAAAKMLATFLKAGSPVSSNYGKTEFTAPTESAAFAKWKGRFKVILNCNNIDEFGLPSFITSYNAKPVLIRNTGTLIRGTNSLNGSNITYTEFDINVHKFSSIPKKALSTLMSKFDQMNIDVGFCIESQEENEMPETILGCATLNKPDPNRAPVFI